MSPAGSIRVGSYGSKTQNSFGSGYTIGLNKFRDPKTLGLNPMFLGPVLGPISIGSCLRTQFSWVLRQNPRFMDP